MEEQRPRFIFYLFWVSVFIMVSIALIFVLDYYNILRILRINPIEVQGITQAKDPEASQQQKMSQSEMQQSKMKQSEMQSKTNQLGTQQLPEIKGSLGPPAYLRNKGLDGDAMFLNNSGTSFQVGYLNIDALFPDDFTTEDAYLPLQFQANGNVIRVEFRIGIGWDNLPPINTLLRQNAYNNIRISRLKVIQFQFRIIQNLEPSVNKRIQRAIQSEINTILQEDRLPADIVNEALRILGIRYTQRGLEDISLEYFP